MSFGHTDEHSQKKMGKQHNVLPLWGNESTMNLNPLILANIQGSSYFKVHLFKLKTYHEVVDEIYYQVKHLEPWERGSRKTSGQTGMCGGVRGVGAGGIVSTAFCLLYKLYTLRLTRKQVNGLLAHPDSPFIRALGFMYIRYTQPPADLYDWYEDYLEDDEEIEVKAGGGQLMTIGQMIYQWLVKLDWFSTLFPRIPVPIQKLIEKKLADYSRAHNCNFQTRIANVDREYGAGVNNTVNGRINRGSNTANNTGREYYDQGGGSSRENERNTVFRNDRRRERSRSPQRNEHHRDRQLDYNRERPRHRDDRRDDVRVQHYTKTRDKDEDRQKDYYRDETNGSGGTSDKHKSKHIDKHRRDREYEKRY